MNGNKKGNAKMLRVAAIPAALAALLSGLPFSASAYDIDTGIRMSG